jgi:hypothetical protein
MIVRTLLKRKSPFDRDPNFTKNAAVVGFLVLTLAAGVVLIVRDLVR